MVDALHKPAPSAWHNPVPGWILASASWAAYRPGIRSTLQATCNACDAADGDGNLLFAFGGLRLWETAGVSRATYWRHIARLEADGFLVCLARGGHTSDGRAYANQWGIPGRPGGLDHRRAARAVVRFTVSDDGRRLRHVVEPGGQLALPGLPDVGGDSLKMRLPQSQNETPPSRVPSPEGWKGFTDGSLREGGVSSHVSRRGLRVRPADLATTGAILALYDRAARYDLAGDSEADRLRFVALAEHAIDEVRRKGGRAHRLFAWLLNRGCWLFATATDEDRARRRLAAHDFGEPHP